ncbi:hypothetical protein OKHIL_68600 [Mycolicibacterium mageritense]
MMTRTTVAVNYDTAPLPPPAWDSILAPFADQLPFPTVCGCTVWRRRGVDHDVHYAAHETGICALRRSDADLAVGAAEVVAVPRLMLASAMWWCHVDVVYDRIRAASSGNLARPAGKRRTASTDVHVTAYATKSGAEVRIDGPSGSGKSALAAQLQELWGDAVTDHYRHRNGGECLRLSTINVQPPIFDVAENNGLMPKFRRNGSLNA